MEEIYDIWDGQCRSHSNLINTPSDQDDNRNHHKRLPITPHLWVVHPHVRVHFELTNAMPHYDEQKIY